MGGRWGRLMGMGLSWLLAASALVAQARPTLTITLPPADSLGFVGPTVRVANVFADRQLRELLDAGFPAQLNFRVELWSSGGWFHRSLGSTSWALVVREDPLHRRFEAVRVIGDSVTPLGVFADMGAVNAEVERPTRAPIRPTSRQAPMYYNVTVTLEMLSVSDLDELQRWVKGDLRPAVRGRRNPGTALSRGTRTLLSRLLGGERRTLEQRSASFVPTAPASR